MKARMKGGWRGGLFDGTACGAGSALKFTGNVREILPIWCERYRIASVADAGAGDLHWIQHVNWPVEYRAYDLIPRHPAVLEWDITRDALPAADAILCRGVLNHLDPERVQMAVDLFRQSGTYLMATQIDQIIYDTYRYIRKNPKAAAEKIKAGHKICRFAQPFKTESGDGEAIMPSILKELLKARKDTRKLIPLQTDDFMKNVLDQRQLGYKVTAISLYGGCGAKTSTFYEKDIAACTTALGRKFLTYGKRIIEECYGNEICDTKNYGQVSTKAEYIYGDTDSVFYTFNLEDLNGNAIRGKQTLEITIELAQQAGEIAASFLKAPHDFEYEKTFMPFCLLSKTIVKYEHWFKSTAGFVYAGKTGDPGKIVDLCDLCVATLSGKEKASSVTPPSIIPYD